MRTKILLYFAVLFISSSCIEKYFPTIDEYKQIIVIEGFLTNLEGPYQVKVSETVDVNNPVPKPITNAEVILKDEFGNLEILTHRKDGLYYTQAGGFDGEIGKKYQLEVKVNGKTYLSSMEIMHEPVGIDSIYFQIEENIDNTIVTEGLQFYVDTEPFESKDKYFLWIPEETFQYTSDLGLKQIMYDYSVIITVNQSNTVCWQTDTLPDVLTLAANELSEPVARKIPLNFVGTESKRLSVRYSLLINQMTINKKAYEFWNTIRLQAVESGSLYPRQPYQIRGNMKCVENPEEIVLGYFTVAGVAKKRIYVGRPNLIFEYPICTPDVQALKDIYKHPRPSFPQYIGYDEVTGDKGLAAQRCFYCEMEGGTMLKPDFWED
jgi:hypothetical protein